MAKSVPALINPVMLVWARESARLTIEQAAAKISIAQDKLEVCEAGEAQLTFAQLMKLAREYRRPVSLFYLKKPPSGWAPIQDFRKFPDAGTGFSPKLTYSIRQARERRELALDLRAELNEPVVPFALTITEKQEAEAASSQIRTYLGITDTEQRQWRTKAFDNWRAAIESKDVLVFTVPRLPLADMRGAALVENELPVILINGKDRTGGKIFTLLHEFCHLAVRQSGVSGSGGDENGAPNPKLERFCNAVAAATLMPKAWLLSEPLVTQKGDQKTWANEELTALAALFGVSREGSAAQVADTRQNVPSIL